MKNRHSLWCTFPPSCQNHGITEIPHIVTLVVGKKLADYGRVRAELSDKLVSPTDSVERMSLRDS